MSIKIHALSTSKCHLDTKATIWGLQNKNLFYTFALENLWNSTKKIKFNSPCKTYQPANPTNLIGGLFFADMTKDSSLLIDIFIVQIKHQSSANECKHNSEKSLHYFFVK